MMMYVYICYLIVYKEITLSREIFYFDNHYHLM